jgi:hypothetical protein
MPEVTYYNNVTHPEDVEKASTWVRENDIFDK